MRFNERELCQYSSGKASKEGRIYHKNPNSGFREGEIYYLVILIILTPLFFTRLKDIRKGGSN